MSSVLTRVQPALYFALMLGGCTALSTQPETAPVKPVTAINANAPNLMRGTINRERDLTVRWDHRQYWAPITSTEHPLHTETFSSTQGGPSSLQVRRLSSDVPSSAIRRHAVPRNELLTTNPYTSPSTLSKPIKPKELKELKEPKSVALAATEPLSPRLPYRIWFAHGYEVLGPEGSERIKQISKTLKAIHRDTPGRTVWLRGFLLEGEVPSSRERCAVNRAVTVRDALRKEGVPEALAIRIYHPRLNLSGRYVTVSVL